MSIPFTDEEKKEYNFKTVLIIILIIIITVQCITLGIQLTKLKEMRKKNAQDTNEQCYYGKYYNDVVLFELTDETTKQSPSLALFNNKTI